MKMFFRSNFYFGKFLLNQAGAVPAILILIVSMLFFSPANAQSTQKLVIEPSWYYQIYTGPIGQQFDSPQATLFAYQTWLNVNSANIKTTVSNVRPHPDSTFYNGKPSAWIWDYVSVYIPSGNPYGSGTTGSIGLNRRNCPVGFNFHSTGTPYSFNFFCVKTVPENKDPVKNSCPADPYPVYAETGLKRQREDDFIDPLGVLSFGRIWRSDYHRFFFNFESSIVDKSSSITSGGVYSGFYPTTASSGETSYVRHNFSYIGDDSNIVWRITPNGDRTSFIDNGTSITPAVDIDDKLIRSTNAQNQPIWIATTADDIKEIYDSRGAITQRQMRGGKTLTYRYSDSATPASIAPRGGLVISVSDDSTGRSVNITYNSKGSVNSFTDPAGKIYLYTYDEPTGNCPSHVLGGNCQRLTSVTYPDGKKRSYHYNESNAIDSSLNPLDAYLTGISDENNSRLSHYKYDAQGRTISSGHGGNNYLFSYNPTSTNVTDPKGTIRTYNFQTLLGRKRIIGLTQPCTSGCGTASVTTYDANGNVASKTDFNGNKICYAYDLTRNLETQRVEGLPSSANCASALASLPANARQIKTQWHPTSRLEIKRAEPKRITTLVYNGQPDPAGGTAACAPAAAQVNGLPIAVLCKKTEQATTDATGALGFSAALTKAPRTSAYTYNALGQVLTVNGPRVDVNNDVTTYTYYSSASNTPGSVHSIGDLATVTNALGHVTSITNYDLNGRPLSITDANGVVTTLEYWPRGWLKTKTVNAAQTTSYQYDGVGQLTQITLPDNSALKYTYDTAHRLTDIEDGYVSNGALILSGNKIHYTLDAMGNRTQEDTRDASVIRKTQSRVFNSLNQLWKDIGGTSPTTQITQYGYDNNGNLKTITDPNNIVTQNTYDAFNRLWTVTTDLNNPSLSSYGVTTYSYDGLDQTTQVKDARLVTTDYTVDGLGNISFTQSPDSGNTTHIHDAAGNVVQKIDARGVTTSYAYDALNRLTQIEYPSDASLSVYFYYDEPSSSFSKGRLSSMYYGTGNEMFFTYDAYGNLKSQNDWVTFSNGTDKQFASNYLFDNANRLQRIAYGVTGRRTIYTRNTLGQITQVQTQDTATAPLVTVINNVSYEPFGPIKGLTFANGVITTIQHDADYRVDRMTTSASPEWDFDYGYDNAGNLTTVSDQGDETTESKNYGYDNLNRVISDFSWVGYTYQYDAGGNRLKREQWPSPPVTQQYAPTSNRETSYNGSAMTADAAGNITLRSNLGQAYSAANRLKQATRNSVTTDYTYNGLGWRNTKQQGASLTHFDYLPDGKLLAQVKLNTDNTHNEIIEYLWLDDLPIAQIKTTYAANNVVSTRRLTYIHADHLNTPRIMTDANKAVVWKWHSDSYGMIAPNANPDGDATTDTLDLRFPGQLYDQESGLYYNMHRYYDPLIGRYTQSDPIGLNGGLNTYGYGDGNPIGNIDPLGLTVIHFYPGSKMAIVDPTNVSDPNSSYYMPATSGRPNCGCDEKAKDNGPIPRGNYTANKNELSKPGVIGTALRNMRGDWGSWRLPLKPDKGTNTYNRDGFYLHGGQFPGSAGCIDVGGGVWGDAATNQLLKDIQDDPDGVVPIIVH